MSSHVVCFKNLLDALMYRLPFLTFTSIGLILSSTGYAATYLIFGHMTEFGERVHIAGEIAVYGFGGGLAMFGVYHIVFNFIPYRGKKSLTSPV